MSSIAERLLQVRGNIKQGEFAAKLEVNPNTLRGYESGRVEPSFQLLAKICVDFSVSTEWLLLGRGEMRARETQVNQAPKNDSVTPCPRCIELYERLYAEMNKVSDLKDKNAALEKELERLKNAQPADNNEIPLASAY